MIVNRNLIIVSFFIIYIVWGSTYLANIIAIESIPPFILVWTRLFVAGSLLLVITKLIGKWERPTPLQARNIVISSLFFLGIGLTGAVWAEQFIDSGITALIISIEPLMIVLLLWIVNKTLPKWNKFIGCIIGMLGMYLLVSQQTIVSGPDDVKGVLSIMMSIIAWAIGSVFISRADFPKSMFTIASLQMLVSAVVIFGLSLAVDDYSNLQISTWELKIFLSWGYLVLFGSVIAYSAFNFLLKNVSPEKVATSTYVHPIVAVFLGWFIRKEEISLRTVIAMIVMLTGVYFINTNTDLLSKIKAKRMKKQAISKY